MSRLALEEQITWVESLEEDDLCGLPIGPQRDQLRWKYEAVLASLRKQQEYINTLTAIRDATHTNAVTLRGLADRALQPGGVQIS